jgi:hypothetical protein
MSRGRCLGGAKRDRPVQLVRRGSFWGRAIPMSGWMSPRTLSDRSKRIVLALLRDVLQFIGSDDGRGG